MRLQTFFALNTPNCRVILGVPICWINTYVVYTARNALVSEEDLLWIDSTFLLVPAFLQRWQRHIIFIWRRCRRSTLRTSLLASLQEARPMSQEIAGDDYFPRNEHGPWKWIAGRQTFPFQKPDFQWRTVSVREKLTYPTPKGKRKKRSSSKVA